jgi:hypothetical protein
MAVDRDALQAEVDRNFQAFRALFPELIKSHAGKFALMRDAAVVEFFDSVRDALVYARRTFPDGRYSVQEIVDQIVDLGYYSHAVP